MRPGLLPLPRAAFAFALVVAATPALAACPESVLLLNGAPAIHTKDARADTTVTYDYPTYGRGRFDLAAGWVAQSAGGAAGGGADATAVDRYTLLGPPGTVPIQARMSIRYVATSCWLQPHGQGPAETSASIVHGTDRADFACASPFPPFGTCNVCNGTEPLTLPLVVAVGVPFEVRWQVRGTAGANNGEESFAFFSFDLPPGYAIESCQGYSTGAVPAERTSWGNVKDRYR